MDEAAEEKFDEKTWLAFKKRVLDDPKKSREWADLVIDSWIEHKSRRSKRPLKHSKRIS
jgi:hypothetical protein